jgi:HTH domain
LRYRLPKRSTAVATRLIHRSERRVWGHLRPYAASLATGCRAPASLAAIADELEVTVRTVYRDVATLQARRIPMEGAAGVGYVLRRGYELPPLMFTEDEAEAIAVGVRLLARTGDPGLQKAAESVLSKVTLVVPDPLRDYLTNAPVYVSKSGAPVPAQRDLPSTIRHAIRAARKMRIAYQDGDGRGTERRAVRRGPRRRHFVQHDSGRVRQRQRRGAGVLPVRSSVSRRRRRQRAAPDRTQAGIAGRCRRQVLAA